ncbi:MAG: hypothetical protein JW863_23455 [Chitinispirillaceae bacterium]|nr:hypothetical protein [Chitinispirillaceae bacterium]
MWLLSFYRFYLSVATGIAGALFLVHSWWFGLLVAIAVRFLWWGSERLVETARINRSFRAHSYAFKQELGPYGIRMINRAGKEASVKRQLAEVFTADEKKLRKAVEQLEMMDTLFKAGMRPDDDTYQLHDLKLKYGKFRLEKIDSDKKDGETR